MLAAPTPLCSGLNSRGDLAHSISRILAGVLVGGAASEAVLTLPCSAGATVRPWWRCCSFSARWTCS